MIEDWEISGNLDNDEGVLNYHIFRSTCITIFNEFNNIFTQEVMQKYQLLIDKAIIGSGHTPIITPILNKYLIIKMHIKDGKEVGQTIFQLAHELTHLIFFSYLGLDKERADDYEEGLCSAVSLALVLKFTPNEIERFKNSLLHSSHKGYQSGVQIAIDHNFSMENLKVTIKEEIEKRKQQA